MVNDVTRFLVAGASCPCPGEVPHSNNKTLVLPTSLTPQHSHEHLVRSVDITAQPREHLIPYLMRLVTMLLMLTFKLRLERGDGDLLAFFEQLEAPGRVQALLTVLLRLATTTTEVLKLALYCHMFVALGMSMHVRTRCVRAHATYGTFYKD